mmetsp:Transcript_15821/g.23498  ORF Transcript_15821/g.23498 Transcript_15821/m.23498 type:complete len:84 (-) Transcript_15821:44-295(-)
MAGLVSGARERLEWLDDHHRCCCCFRWRCFDGVNDYWEVIVDDMMTMSPPQHDSMMMMTLGRGRLAVSRWCLTGWGVLASMSL